MPLPNRTAAAAKLPTGNSEITNSPLSRWNGNTATGRRARDLFRAYLSTLGNPADTPTLALVLAAAEQTVIAENARRDHLEGKLVLSEVVRAEGMAARALRRVGLNKPVPPPRKSLMEKLTEQEAARKATEGRPAADAAKGAETTASAAERASADASQAGEALR
ncbi:hypothetical protein BDS110ZK23_20570 [Bradyrhizobium diazoefficiens]|uniref:Uncharacterized protein n=1 Tax=Bradyrhizobium diazoefficiens TaxID=1355477 RepID=A0A810C8R5_9BRAD|nr:hypothetical protein XF2B_40680 [Bradyrhizobium diazoefficiens]BCE85027.1 hypothetical protein XF9B_64480 [Bradyrhizobium diazoefficiens]BCF00063.1 hypothetical protein XF11B_40830 [Bradyrhizobium diazoefficiens]BCF11126.1 hypothetical protein XF12B_64990 [Bradyrhizobium diazoefficiens]BCF17369.1 hypothetical protein XF13B_40600 [Bradyrhizobium diazoefficiens]